VRSSEDRIADSDLFNFHDDDPGTGGAASGQRPEL